MKVLKYACSVTVSVTAAPFIRIVSHVLHDAPRSISYVVIARTCPRMSNECTPPQPTIHPFRIRFRPSASSLVHPRLPLSTSHTAAAIKKIQSS